MVTPQLTGPAVTRQQTFVITDSVRDERTTRTSGKLKRPLLPSYLLHSYQRLAELAALREDWDSYGALPIDDKSLIAARRLLSRISRELPEDAADASPFALAPLADGGIQIEWRGDQTALEIEVDPLGRLSSLFVEQHETGPSCIERDRLPVTEVAGLVTQTLGL